MTDSNTSNDNATNEVTSTTNAAMIDLSVRTGTANVMQQRQWGRFLYTGEHLCECKMTLEPEKSSADSGTYSMISITTDQPVQISFVNADESMLTMTVNKVLVLDSQVSDLTITNTGTTAANISVTKIG